MGKRIPVNEKAQAARDRKAAKKAEESAREERRKEDAYWEQHANPKSKRHGKKEEAEARREEAAAKKAEAKRLAEAEEAALAASASSRGRSRPAAAAAGRPASRAGGRVGGGGISVGGSSALSAAALSVRDSSASRSRRGTASPDASSVSGGSAGLASPLSRPGSRLGGLSSPPSGKVTRHELELIREREAKERQTAIERSKKASRREVDESDYAAIVEVENRNADEDANQASGLDAALERLGISAGPNPHAPRPGSALGGAGGVAGAEDRHPERRAKAAWETYFEQQLPIYKENKPGLRLMQYKGMIFDAWQKSPENPRNAIERR